MRIPEETVNRILDATDLVDVVSDFVSLKRRGASYVACCPFHNEKTPSFYVTPSKGIYKCFGCGKAGSAVQFVMDHENLSYAEALQYLARKYHIEIEEVEDDPGYRERKSRQESLMQVSEFAMRHFQANLEKEEGRNLGYQYFLSRGLEPETIRKYCLGWAMSSRHALLDDARLNGYKEEYLLDTGLCGKREDSGALYDRFYERAIFPIHSETGRVIAFGGRTLRSDFKDAHIGKYVNSNASDIYDKSRSLYGIHFAKSAIVKADSCILVEGYLDVLSMHQLGILNVVASSGTSLTVPQIRLIKRFTSNVTIIYDGDAAGIHAALRGIGLVLKEGLNVSIVLLPDGDDPDSYSRKHTLEEVQDFIKSHSRDFIGFKTDLLLEEAGNDPLKRANLINDIADTVALIPDPIQRASYIKSCAVKFDLDEQLLYNRANTSREAMLEADRREWERNRLREERQAAAGDGEAPEPDTEASAVVAKTEAAPKSSPVVITEPKLAASEKGLLSFILLYGFMTLGFEEDSPYYVNPPMNVVEFIDSALNDEQKPLSFVNPSYRKVYEAYMALYFGDGQLDEKRILSRLQNTDDPETKAVVMDILDDKYRISVNSFKNSLTEDKTVIAKHLPMAIRNYQLERVKLELSRIQRLMLTQPERTEEFAREIVSLTRTKNMLSRELGKV